MSGKKFEISRLTNIRMQVVRALKNNEYYNNEDSKFSCQVCVDWDEFNKLYFSKRPSVIHCHEIAHRCWCDNGYNFISLYAAMKMALDMKKVHVITRDHYYPFNIMTQVKDFYDAVVPTKNICRWSEIVNLFSDAYCPSFSDICKCDEIVVVPGTYIIDYEWLSSLFNELSKPEHRGVKLTMLIHDTKINDESKVHYNELKKRFPDFLYFDYTNEKKFVDDWFENNDTLIDPEFDIKVTDPELDKKKVWRYIATNHKYKFREYCKFDKEFVMKNMPMKELKEYGIF